MRPIDKLIIVTEGNRATIKPLKRGLLDIGGSIKIPGKEKPIDFKKVREEVKKRIAKKIATKA